MISYTRKKCLVTLIGILQRLIINSPQRLIINQTFIVKSIRYSSRDKNRNPITIIKIFIHMIIISFACTSCYNWNIFLSKETTKNGLNQIQFNITNLTMYTYFTLNTTKSVYQFSYKNRPNKSHCRPNLKNILRYRHIM